MLIYILINSLVARLVMELLLSLRMDLLFLLINHEIEITILSRKHQLTYYIFKDCPLSDVINKIKHPS